MGEVSLDEKTNFMFSGMEYNAMQNWFYGLVFDHNVMLKD
jgi:hypothetical protein